MRLAGYNFPMGYWQKISPGYYEVEDISKQIQLYSQNLSKI